MRQFLMNFLRVFRFPLLLTAATLPVTLIVLMFLAPALLPFVWLLPLNYLVLDLLGTRVRGKKWRVSYSIAGTLVLMGIGLYAGAMTTKMWLLSISGLYGVLFIWGMATSALRRYEKISPEWYCVGIVVHICAQLVLYSDRVTETHALDPVSFFVTASFFLFAALAMLSINQTNLSFAASGRQSVSETMRRKNTVLVLVFFAIAALISMIPALANGASVLLQWILIAVMWVINTIASIAAPNGGSGAEGGGGGGMMMPGMEQQKEQSLFLQILTVFAAVLAVLAIVALVGYGIYKLIKGFPKLLRLIGRLLNRYVTAVSEDFVDEITDTRDTDDADRIVQKKKVRGIDERKLPPEERIRYRYLRLMVKHKWSRGSTARENLPDSMAPLYERVRYSVHTVTEEDAQRFSAESKKV